MLISGQYALTLLEGPSEAVFTPSDVTTHRREENTDQDAVINRHIGAVTRHFEGLTGRKLLTQEWSLSLDAFPCPTYRKPFAPIDLPYPPLQSVESITYIDENGDEQTLATSVYSVVTGSLVGRVELKYDQEWPDTRCQPGAVTIAFTCGYGAPDEVPEDIQDGLLLLIGDLYENREAQVTGTIMTRNETYRNLVDLYRIPESP